MQPLGRLTKSLKGKEELLVSGTLLALGLYIILGASAIRVPSGANRVGPRFFPYLVGSLLTAVSIWISIDILGGNFVPAEENDQVDPSQRAAWWPMLLIIGLIVVHALMVSIAGWVIAAAVLFWGVVAILGSRRWWLDAIVAFAFATLLYLLFTRVMNFPMPAGILEGIL